MDHVRGTQFGRGADVVSVPVSEHRPVIELGAFTQVFEKKRSAEPIMGSILILSPLVSCRSLGVCPIMGSSERARTMSVLDSTKR
jgi:hypothetical protein